MNRSYLELSATTIDGFSQIHREFHQPKIRLEIPFLLPFSIVFLDQHFRSPSPVPYRRIEMLQPTHNTYLKHIGFEFLANDAEVHSSWFNSQNAIRMRNFSSLTEAEHHIVEWVTGAVLPHFPSCTPPLRKDIVEQFWEIVSNALEHGQSLAGISMCGQYFPKKHYVEIAFYDAGIGIPSSVRRYDSRFTAWSDVECIEWALEAGNTTRSHVHVGGSGLHVLEKFLAINKGILQIASGNGYYKQHGATKERQTLQHHLQGTLVNIRVHRDSFLYSYRPHQI
jgi:hypothetical protein